MTGRFAMKKKGSNSFAIFVSVILDIMNDKGIVITGIKLEISAIDDNRNSEGPLIVFQSRPLPNGKSSVSCKASTTDKDFARETFAEIADYLVKVAGSMPSDLPEVLDPSGDPWDDYTVVRDLAGEGAKYVKNKLPYGQHTVMLNTSIKRHPNGQIEKVSGSPYPFHKLEPKAGSKKPKYQILTKGGWEQIRDIEEYIKQHKLAVYKLHT